MKFDANETDATVTLRGFLAGLGVALVQLAVGLVFAWVAWHSRSHRHRPGPPGWNPR